MEQLFRVVIYLVIFIIWIAANLKRGKRWDDELPEFPPEEETASSAEEPAREGYHPETVPIPAPQPTHKAKAPQEPVPVTERPKKRRRFDSMRQYEEYRAQKARERELAAHMTAHRQTPEQTPQTDILCSYTAALHPAEPRIRLRGDPRQGILWSIVLGPCRAKTGPFKRNP